MILMLLLEEKGPFNLSKHLLSTSPLLSLSLVRKGTMVRYFFLVLLLMKRSPFRLLLRLGPDSLLFFLLRRPSHCLMNLFLPIPPPTPLPETVSVWFLPELLIMLSSSFSMIPLCTLVHQILNITLFVGCGFPLHLSALRSSAELAAYLLLLTEFLLLSFATPTLCPKKDI